MPKVVGGKRVYIAAGHIVQCIGRFSPQNGTLRIGSSAPADPDGMVGGRLQVRFERLCGEQEWRQEKEAGRQAENKAVLHSTSKNGAV